VSCHTYWFTRSHFVVFCRYPELLVSVYRGTFMWGVTVCADDRVHNHSESRTVERRSAS
jgi:hypothetical protein